MQGRIDPIRPYPIDCCVRMYKKFIFENAVYHFNTFEFNYWQNVMPICFIAISDDQKVSIQCGLINKYCL